MLLWLRLFAAVVVTHMEVKYGGGLRTKQDWGRETLRDGFGDSSAARCAVTSTAVEHGYLASAAFGVC